jgi:endonuclease YncB( thermonuclease family)
MLFFLCVTCWPHHRRVLLWLLLAGALGGSIAGRAQQATPGGWAAGPVDRAAVEHQPLPWTYTARVTRVFDGDTLWVEPLAGGRYRKLRLDGVDAPEICQTRGSAARDALASHALDKVVTVRVRAWDAYGRALARVSTGGQDVGAVLVQGGHAWSSRWRSSPGPYAAEEARARAERKGVFGVDGPEETARDFRRRHGPCPMS